MAKSMTKSQIADYLAQKTGLTKKASVQLMDDFAALAYKEAKNVFVIPGLGKLVLANRKARMGRNPQTGEAIKIQPSVCSSSAWPKPPRTRSSERSKQRSQSHCVQNE